MDTHQLAALADPARWRIVSALAEGPRSVGVIAQLTGMRQPQTTKHLQTLDRAGIVVSRRAAQRRIYALEPEPLRDLARRLTELAEAVEAHRAAREAYDRYFMNVAAETLAADRDHWADERVFTFRRTLAADRATVWRYVTDAGLMADWLTPSDLETATLEFEPRPGARIVQEYRHLDDAAGVDGVVGRAEGVVDEVDEPDSVAFRLSPLLPGGGVAFTGHYRFVLRDEDEATAFEVRLRITDSTIPSAQFVGGIDIGWNQSLDRLVAAVAAAPGSATPRPARSTSSRPTTSRSTPSTPSTKE